MPAVMPMREAVMLWRLERVCGQGVSGGGGGMFAAGGWDGGRGGYREYEGLSAGGGGGGAYLCVVGEGVIDDGGDLVGAFLGDFGHGDGAVGAWGAP